MELVYYQDGRKKMKLTIRPRSRNPSASQLLEQVSQLSDDEAEIFMEALGDGVFDEWDCGLDTFFGLFGAIEFKIATNSASNFARSYEESYRKNGR